MALFQPDEDRRWMEEALKLAEQAGAEGEVPVGAILVRGGEIIASGRNEREKAQNPLGHAELLCLKEASQKLNSWRLMDTTLYVTLEPCPMCAGALVQARVKRLVFGASDPKAGAVTSLYSIPTDERLAHRLEVTGGVLEEKCSELLKEFFKKLRQSSSLKNT